MQKLKEGQKFNEVASAYSEDKARQGVSEIHQVHVCTHSHTLSLIMWTTELLIQAKQRVS